MSAFHAFATTACSIKVNLFTLVQQSCFYTYRTTLHPKERQWIWQMNVCDRVELVLPNLYSVTGIHLPNPLALSWLERRFTSIEVW